MIGVVLLCLAATELTVAVLAGRGPGVVPTARHRLTGLGLGAVVVLLTLVFVALTAPPGGHGGSAGLEVAPYLLAGALALGVASAWTAAGTRAWASPVLMAVLVLLAGLEFSAYGGLHLALHTGWPVVLGAAAFLVEPANRITRDVLELAGRREARTAAAAESRSEASVDDAADASAAAATEPTGDRTDGVTGDAAAAATAEADSADADPASGLKGGRYIGPVERILMAGLGLVGAYPVVAALMAAKGIVRFPEISADAGKGSRAEEFLVGSLTSWALAFVAAVLVLGTLPLPLLDPAR